MKNTKRTMQIVLIITILIMILSIFISVANSVKLSRKNQDKASEYNTYRGTILNIPIDSRPITRSNLYYLMEAAGYDGIEVGTQYLDSMDQDKKYHVGDSAGVRESLSRTLSRYNLDNSSNTIIINTASYFFGGLIGSRSYTQYGDREEKINDLREIVTQYNMPEYYVIIQMPRIYPDNRILEFPLSVENNSYYGLQHTLYTPTKGLQEYYKEYIGESYNAEEATYFQDAVIEWIYCRYWQKADGHSWSQFPQYVKDFCIDFKNAYSDFLENYDSAYSESFYYMSDLIDLNSELQAEGKKPFNLIISVDDYTASPFIAEHLDNGEDPDFNYISQDQNGNIVKYGPWYYYNSILEQIPGNQFTIIPGADEIHHVILAKDLVSKTGIGIGFNYLDPLSNEVLSSNLQELTSLGKYDQVSVGENLNIRDEFINQSATKTVTVDTYLNHFKTVSEGGTNYTNSQAQQAAQNIYNNNNKKAVIGVHYFDQRLFKELVNYGDVFDLPYCSAWNTVGNSTGVGLASIVVEAILESEMQEAITNNMIDSLLIRRIKYYTEYKVLTVLEGVVYNSNKSPNQYTYQEENELNTYGDVLAERISYVGGQGPDNGASLIQELLNNNTNELYVYSMGNYTYTISNVDVVATRPWYRTFEVEIYPTITMAEEHNYDNGQTTITPTCTEEGEKTFTCILCGNTYTSVIPALGHNWSNNYIVDQIPTCEEDGIKSKHCLRCSARTGETSIPATGHTCNEGVVTQEPTCTQTGIKTFTCVNCDWITTEVVPALGHSWNIEYTVDNEPTCEEDGIKSKHCLRCSARAGETSISALGHNAVIDERIEPTCRTPGLTRGSHCSRCNKVLVEQEVISMIEHQYENGRVTKEATCTEKGEIAYTCRLCGGISIVVTDALGHDYQETIVPPTCTIRGYTNHKCSRCGNEYNDTYVATIAHNYQDGICTMCGEEQPQIFVDSPKYDVRTDGKISNIDPKTTVDVFLVNIEVPENASKRIVDQKGATVLDDKKIGTEMKLIVEKGELKIEYIVIVKGDTDGDGDATFLDMVDINNHRLGTKLLDDIKQEAGDVNKDGKIDFFDIVDINKFRLKIKISF